MLTVTNSCERENKWMDEGPYQVDSSIIAQSSGGRRRRSMEPRVLENMNGTLLDGSSNGQGGGSSQTPARAMNRRDSTAWMRTPSDQGDEEQDDIDWSKYILTPVPKTPAPEAVAKYAAEIPIPETPAGGDESTCGSPETSELVTRTCPPKSRPMFEMKSPGLFERGRKDEQVVQRLLAAKRKSLQFAPRIASPLSKTWE